MLYPNENPSNCTYITLNTTRKLQTIAYKVVLSWVVAKLRIAKKKLLNLWQHTYKFCNVGHIRKYMKAFNYGIVNMANIEKISLGVW